MQANSPEQAENNANYSNPGTIDYQNVELDQYIDTLEDQMDDDYYEDDVLNNGQMDFYDYNEQPMDGDYFEENPQLQNDPNIPTKSNAYYSKVNEVYSDAEAMIPMEESPQGIHCMWATVSNPICGWAFRTPTELINHIWTDHKMERSNSVCYWRGCDRKLRPIMKKCHALIHLRRHTVESAYKCQTCNVEYYDSWKSRNMETRGPLKCLKCKKEEVKKTQKNHLLTTARPKSHNKPPKCSKCLMKFDTKEALHAHMTCHTGKKQYRCTIPGCSRVFGYQSTLDLHIDQWHGEDAETEEVIQCVWMTNGRVCNLLCLTPTDLEEHIKSEHIKKVGRIACGWQMCERVGRMISRKCRIIQHVETHTKPFWCNVCNKRFHNSDDLLQHGEVHMDVEQQESLADAVVDAELYDDTEGYVDGDDSSVPSCSYSSQSVAARNEELGPGPRVFLEASHSGQQLHMNEQPLQAKHADLQEHPGSGLTEIVPNNHQEPPTPEDNVDGIRCLWTKDDRRCVKVFQNILEMHTHVTLVHTKRMNTSIVCHWRGCNARVGSKYLLAHLQLHIGEKEFECSVCNEQFSSQKDLENHMVTHSLAEDSEPQETMCLWKTGNQVCMHPYQTFADLLIHIKAQHGGEGTDFVCRWKGCKRTTFSPKIRHAVAHLRTHTRKKMFKCDACHKTYSGLHYHQHLSHCCTARNPEAPDSPAPESFTGEDSASSGSAPSKILTTKHWAAPVNYSSPSEQDLGAHYEGAGLEYQEAIYNDQQLPQQPMGEINEVPRDQQRFLRASSRPPYSEQIIHDRIIIEEPPSYGCSGQGSSGAPVNDSSPSEQDLRVHYENPDLESPETAYSDQQLSLEDQSMGNNSEALMEFHLKQMPRDQQHFLRASSRPTRSEQVIYDRIIVEEPPSYGCSGQGSSVAPVAYSYPSDQDMGLHYEYLDGQEFGETIYNEQQLPPEDQPTEKMENMNHQNLRTFIPFGQVYNNWSNIPQ